MEDGGGDASLAEETGSETGNDHTSARSVSRVDSLSQCLGASGATQLAPGLYRYHYSMGPHASQNVAREVYHGTSLMTALATNDKERVLQFIQSQIGSGLGIYVQTKTHVFCPLQL